MDAMAHGVGFAARHCSSVRAGYVPGKKLEEKNEMPEPWDGKL